MNYNVVGWFFSAPVSESPLHLENTSGPEPHRKGYVMAVYTTTPSLKKQWTALTKKEHSFLEKQYEAVSSPINDKVEEYIPDKLRDAMDTGFFKAFELIFDKGTDIIEKTYSKEKHESAYMTNEFADTISAGKNGRAAFSKRSGASRLKNLLISGVEGIGLGILGVGLPDIPVFTAVILKSIYETALSYGYDYDTEEEQLFILKIIETSMSHGDTLYENDKQINSFIYSDRPFEISRKEQIRITSDSIASELIYMKFIQTLPVAGVIGGAYDMVFLNRILKYADLKYQRRRLFSKIKASSVTAEREDSGKSGTKQTFDTDNSEAAENSKSDKGASISETVSCSSAAPDSTEAFTDETYSASAEGLSDTASVSASSAALSAAATDLHK